MTTLEAARAVAPFDALLARASARPERVLLESEGMALLDALGFATPRREVVANADAIARWDASPLAGERVVLKALSPRILHKTDAKAVTVVANRVAALHEAAREMETRLAEHALEGFLVCEFVPHEAGPGREFLLGLRHTRDFGIVVTLAAGGVHAEFLGRALRAEQATAIFSPELDREDVLDAALDRFALARLAIEPQRGHRPLVFRSELVGAVRRLLAFARTPQAAAIAEFEVNPLVVSEGRLVALDALARLAGAPEVAPAPRPIARIRTLLEPRTIAVMGVSERMNPGRIILRNVLREGFDPADVTIVKPGTNSIDGCACVPEIGDVPAPVDLLVLSIPAPQAAEVIARAADEHLAESIVLIPGGLEEKAGNERLVTSMREAIERSRRTEWGGPVINGGNCLGVRSLPGHFDTLFIPEHKLPRSARTPDPIAFVTGSGAFAVSKASKLAGLQPLYTITIGNQTDLTVADYLAYLATDERVKLTAIYVEGFRPLDGARFVREIEGMTRAGRPVIAYLAGRTAAGAAAAASHTAAVAGDHVVASQLARAAGAIVADSLEDFEDLVRLFARLQGRRPGAGRIGALTNAGFESVAIADSLGAFRLAEFSPTTRASLAATLDRARLGEIVAVHNPMDVTPILGDEGYESALRAMLADPGVDAAVLGCVPLTAALATLPAGDGHSDDLTREDGVVPRLVSLWNESQKPWVAVVDAGPLYDPMAAALEAGGIPVFRTADRALRLFGCWAQAVRTESPAFHA
ncbi:MAG: acetate--CoA ligase family protein [Candidatus Eisenbacteria bacterium]